MALHKPEHRTVKYWLLWLPMTLGFLIVFPVAYPIVGRQTGSWLRDWEDYIDDPIDWVKEWLHCHPLPFGYFLNISPIMMNRKTSWNIVTKNIECVDCDHEDEPLATK